MIDELREGTLISCRRSLQVCDSFVAVQVFVLLGLNCLLYCTKRVFVHGNVRFEPKLQTALVLTIDRNRALIFTLTGLCCVRVDVAVRHVEVLRLSWISTGVWHEEELVRAQVQLTRVLGLRKLTYFKSIHGHLFLLVI